MGSMSLYHINKNIHLNFNPLVIRSLFSSGVGGLLGGGGKVSPWLTPEISHQKMDVFNLLGSDNKLSINSFDVLQGKVVCGGARQTLFCTDSCDE